MGIITKWMQLRDFPLREPLLVAAMSDEHAVDRAVSIRARIHLWPPRLELHSKCFAHHKTIVMIPSGNFTIEHGPFLAYLTLFIY